MVEMCFDSVRDSLIGSRAHGHRASEVRVNLRLQKKTGLLATGHPLGYPVDMLFEYSSSDSF